MFINPRDAIQAGWIKFPESMRPDEIEKCIQPNAIDFTLDKLYTITKRNKFVISEREKKMRGGNAIPTEMDPTSNDEWWTLQPDSVYDGLSDFYVEIPEGVAAMLVPRSTLSRNGVYLTSGIYDSGFRGNVGCAIHNRSGLVDIARGTRVGQIIFIQSDSAGSYAGGYNHDHGTHWSGNESK